MGGQRLELVRGGHKGQAGDLGDLMCDALVPADPGVQAGADSGAALGEFVDLGQDLVDAQDALADLMRIAGKLLAQRQGCRILGMGATDLDDVLEFD